MRADTRVVFLARAKGESEPLQKGPRCTEAVRQSIAVAKARFTAGSLAGSLARSLRLGIHIAHTLLDSADLNLDVDQVHAARHRARCIHDRYLHKLGSTRICAEDRAEIHDRLVRLDARLAFIAS